MILYQKKGKKALKASFCIIRKGIIMYHVWFIYSVMYHFICITVSRTSFVSWKCIKASLNIDVYRYLVSSMVKPDPCLLFKPSNTVHTYLLQQSGYTEIVSVYQKSSLFGVMYLKWIVQRRLFMYHVSFHVSTSHILAIVLFTLRIMYHVSIVTFQVKPLHLDIHIHYI